LRQSLWVGRRESSAASREEGLQLAETNSATGRLLGAVLAYAEVGIRIY
jgi:hypothetical protein